MTTTIQICSAMRCFQGLAAMCYYGQAGLPSFFVAVKNAGKPGITYLKYYIHTYTLQIDEYFIIGTRMCLSDQNTPSEHCIRRSISGLTVTISLLHVQRGGRGEMGGGRGALQLDQWHRVGGSLGVWTSFSGRISQLTLNLLNYQRN